MLIRYTEYRLLNSAASGYFAVILKDIHPSVPGTAILQFSGLGGARCRTLLFCHSPDSVPGTAILRFSRFGAGHCFFAILAIR